MVKAPEQNAFEKCDIETCKLGSADQGLSAVGERDECEERAEDED
jgi:hypothetical protein